MDDTNSMEGQSWLQLLQSLPPEQLQQWLALGEAPGKQTELETQLQRAQALRDKPSEAHTTVAGGVLGGVADLLNGYRGIRDERAAQTKIDALGKETTKGRADFVGTLGRLQQQQMARAAALRGQPAPPQPLQPQQPPMYPGAPPFLFGGQ